MAKHLLMTSVGLLAVDKAIQQKERRDPYFIHSLKDHYRSKDYFSLVQNIWQIQLQSKASAELGVGEWYEKSHL